MHENSIQYKSALNKVGGIAQWQSIRLQIERSPVQLRLPPTVLISFQGTQYPFRLNKAKSNNHNTIFKENNIHLDSTR